MTKIFGTKLTGILLATLLFFLLGYLWYGFLFKDLWMALSGVGDQDPAPLNLLFGGLISLGQVLGLAYILNYARSLILTTCVKICTVIALLISLPVAAYHTNYIGTPVKLLAIDVAYMFVGYCLIGAVLSFFRKDERTIQN